MNTPARLSLLRDLARLIRTALLAAFVFTIPALRAQSLFFQASDQPDTTPGQDLWRYSFSFSGFNFQAGQGFSIFFDPLSIPALQATPPPVGPDWSILSIQPDLILRQPGYYDALALRNNPSLGSPFTVDFVWQGQGTPGAQPWTIYNTDFSTLFAGQTVVVPEPAVATLAGLALMALLLRRIRMTNRPR